MMSKSSLRLFNTRHRSTRQLPEDKRSSDIENMAMGVLLLGLKGFYNILIFLFDRWYGYIAMAGINLFMIIFSYDSFSFVNVFVFFSLAGIGILFKYFDSHVKPIPKLDFLPLFGSNDGVQRIANKLYSRYGKNHHDRVSRDERHLAAQVMRMLIDNGLYDVVDMHTGRSDLAGYEIEKIQVPSVVADLEQDEHGFSKIELRVLVPFDQFNKLSSLNDTFVAVVSKFFRSDISLLTAEQSSGEYVLKFADANRDVVFDFNDEKKGEKKEVKSMPDSTSNGVVSSYSDSSNQHQYNELLSKSQATKDYEVPITEDITWNLSKAQHAIIAGKSGSGKTYFLNYLIMMFGLHDCSLYIADPKRSDLSDFGEFIGDDRVATDASEIMDMAKHVVDVMNDRYERMKQLRSETKKFQVDFTEFGIKPLILVIDEMASLMTQFDTPKEAKQFQAYIKQITLKGRQAGVEFISVMQQPNAQNISTEARDQFGFRVLLGTPNSQERQMMFGSVEDYPSLTGEVGQGFYVLDGFNSEPRVLLTPRLERSKTALYDTLVQVFSNYTPSD